mmetsp:Transcript_49065/g.87234  ORF Transcript_49065/g.87234 Transcript_49065/m.87234 type:complete len:230 (-) Transcript_49065:375-1064(-)
MPLQHLETCCALHLWTCCACRRPRVVQSKTQEVYQAELAVQMEGSWAAQLHSADLLPHWHCSTHLPNHPNRRRTTLPREVFFFWSSLQSQLRHLWQHRRSLSHRQSHPKHHLTNHHWHPYCRSRPFSKCRPFPFSRCSHSCSSCRPKTRLSSLLSIHPSFFDHVYLLFFCQVFLACSDLAGFLDCPNLAAAAAAAAAGNRGRPLAETSLRLQNSSRSVFAARGHHQQPL